MLLITITWTKEHVGHCILILLYLEWPVSTDSGVIQHMGALWFKDIIPAVVNIGTRGVHVYVVNWSRMCIETDSLKSHSTTEPSSWRTNCVMMDTSKHMVVTDCSYKHQWYLVWTETAARWVGLRCQHTIKKIILIHTL